jgi:hypothetical protein
MIDVARILDDKLKAAGVPIDGVSVGDPLVRSTWRIAFATSATPAQRTQGQSIVDTAVVDAAAQTIVDQKDAQVGVDQLPIILRAVVLALIDQLNVIRAALPTPLSAITPAQAIAVIRAKAGTL